MKARIIFLLAILLIVAVPKLTSAGFVSGAAGKEDFEAFRKEFCDSFVDFEEFDTGPLSRLDPFPVGLQTTYFRYPYPSGVGPAPLGTPVVVLPYNFVTSPSNHRLMGVSASNIPDGQSKYEISFDSPQKRVGLMRIWNTLSITRFYGDSNKLLYEHQNNTNNEFVGYICDNNTPCINRIEFDGLPSDPDSEYNKLYQVGEVDDLYFSVPAIELNLEVTPYVKEGKDAKMTVTVKSIVSYDIESIKVNIDYQYLDADSEDKFVNVESDYMKIPARETITMVEHDFNTKELMNQTISVEATLFSPWGTEIDKTTKNIVIYRSKPSSQVTPTVIRSILLLLKVQD